MAETFSRLTIKSLVQDFLKTNGSTETLPMPTSELPMMIAALSPAKRSTMSSKMIFRSGHADDVLVMDDGIIFGSSSDQGAGGLWVIRRVPGVRGPVDWNAAETDVIVIRTYQPRNID